MTYAYFDKLRISNETMQKIINVKATMQYKPL